MPNPLPAGPFEHVDLGGGVSAPLYLVPFDKHGRVKASQTRQHLVTAAGSGSFSHLFFVSHGWNNDFPTSLGLYRRLFEKLKEVRQGHPLPGDFKPLLVGVIWPSTALVLPNEKAPKMAADGLPPDLADAADIDQMLEELEEIAEMLPAESQQRFFELAGREEALTEAEALELARLLAPLYAGAEDLDPEAEEDVAGGAPDPQDLVTLWRAVDGVLSPAPLPDADDDEEQFGGLDDGGDAPGAGPDAAFLGKLDPRKIVRSFTVWKMKDRAGKVGRAGAGPLLADLVAAVPDGTKVHLVGHSYGAKVVLSAANALPAGAAVTSALLLQPAINGWAFAANVAGEGFAGGYRRVLSLVDQPICSTFSRKDVPLTKLFHLAVRRKADLGELKAAAAAPSRFAALGGFGPQGLGPPEAREIEMPAAGIPYPDELPTELLALRGHDLVDGHGDVTTEHTAWALWQQVARAGEGGG